MTEAPAKPAEETADERAVYFRRLNRQALSPPIPVETEASAENRARLIARVQASWSDLGKRDPHWSVLTNERYRADRISETLDEFYTTGEHTLAFVRAALARCGGALGEIGHVTDLGCGVGRVTTAFARAGCTVTAVDISANHLAVTRDHLARTGLADRVETVQLTALETLDTLPETDLFFSVIVLQHNPPPIMAEMLRRTLARVRPGGHAYFQVPTYKDGYRYRVADDLRRTKPAMEMHVLPAPAVFQVLEGAGFRPLEVRRDSLVGDLAFESHAFLARKHGPAHSGKD